MTRFLATLAAAPALFATPASSQAAGHGDPATDPACANVRVAIPRELAGWSQRTDVRAGTVPALAPVLLIGSAATVALTRAPVTWAAAPAKAPPPGTGGGLLQVEIRRAGTYRLALGAPAWADVTLRGQRVPSIAHAMGPRCTGVRKLVDFTLARGRYVVQLSGAPTANVVAMMVPVK